MPIERLIFSRRVVAKKYVKLRCTDRIHTNSTQISLRLAGTSRFGMCAACEAGASIKPGVERGFASETPGQVCVRTFSAREAGDSAVFRNVCRPLRGLTFILIVPWGYARNASLHPRLYAYRPLRGLTVYAYRPASRTNCLCLRPLRGPGA